MSSLTASALLDTQATLLQEAAEALPHLFTQCTHRLGYIRQAVYLCQTCNEKRGICSACSVACHTDHEQLELFPKRKFRCDCPTVAMSHPCTLQTTQEEANTQNTYNHNFDAKFCRCGRPYDPKVELETMIQCLSCEDWFHESCLNLRERPPAASRAPTPEASAVEEEAQEGDDANSEASSSGLPPPLIGASSYDALICSQCVQKVETLKKYAGTPGVLMAVRDDPQDPWRIIGRLPDENEPIDIGTSVSTNGASSTAVGEKRPHPDISADAPSAKRPRPTDEASSSENPRTATCLAPSPSPLAQRILSGANDLGAGDIFLTEGWRDRWCKCSDCLPSLQAYPFLLEEEETYEAPDDPDVGVSLEELGLRALQNLPRDRAIDGIRAFNEMRDQLMVHLRPFAEEGKVVTEADIRKFFEETMGARSTV